jgi:SAM-dependent methyltransferase
MFPGNYDLQEYYTTAQGRFVFKVLSERIKDIWPLEDQSDTDFAGFGYTFPYLDAYAATPEDVNKKPRKNADEKTFKAPRTVAIVSRQAGMYYWPQGQDNRTVLCRRSEWPFPKESLDRILVIHDGEYASGLQGFLHEVYRVLKPNGRLLMVMPNRKGMWARSDRNPFGHGAPYSLSQLRSVLRECHFVNEGAYGALLTPPLRSKTLLNVASTFLEPCARYCPAMAGVQLVEASKRVYAPTGRKERAVETIRTLVWPAPAGSRPLAG